MPVTSSSTKRKSRAKSLPVWDALQSDANRIFSEGLIRIAAQYPCLTTVQLYVAAFVKAGLKSWQIAEKFCVSEHDIEKIRSRIRKAIGLPHEIKLAVFLAAI